jgi:hypothetical protein
MTFDDDIVVLNHPCRTLRIPCVKLGLEWPPPEILGVGEYGTFSRVNYSKITDEERARMTHVVRGAEYNLVKEKR